MALSKGTEHKIREDRFCYKKWDLGSDVIYQGMQEEGPGGGGGG